MSRNRTAILADIAEFNLDPNVAHATTHANGRLAKKSASEQTPEVAEVVGVEETPTVVVQEEIPNVETEEKVEAATEEQPVQTDAEEPKVDATPKKKGKKQPIE